MSIFDKIVGLVPTVKDRVKSVLEYSKSTAVKIGVVAVISVSALIYSHHLGAKGQQKTIDNLRYELSIERSRVESRPANIKSKARRRHAPKLSNRRSQVSEPVSVKEKVEEHEEQRPSCFLLGCLDFRR